MKFSENKIDLLSPRKRGPFQASKRFPLSRERHKRLIAALVVLLLLPACTEVQYAAHLAKQIPFPSDTPKTQGTFKVGTPYKIMGKYYYPKETYSFEETGIASWYGPNFHGKQTANGEIFDQNELTAAHKTLQMPSLVRVTNLENGRSMVLRVNDRGPYSRGRILDVSKRSAELLGFKNKGTAKIKLQVLGPESRQIAQVAKTGKDTRGFEVAMNNNGVLPQTAQPIPAAIEPAAAPSSQGGQVIQMASLEPVDKQSLGSVPVHAAPDGRLLPDPVVKTVPVTPSNIFVQAGSFTQEKNALELSQKLQTIGPSRVYKAFVNGRDFYRVRLGPFEQVERADIALNSLVVSGNENAIIVVD